MTDYRMDAVIGTAKHIKELADAQIKAIETDHAAALRERDERIAALEKALRLVAERFMPDGSLCFCRIPDGHKFIHHEEWCVNARAALEAK